MAGRLLSPFKGLFSLPERRRVPVVIEMNQHRPATLTSRAEMDKASRASAAGLGCIRGTSFAFLFEAGAALLIYGMFQLWHVFR
jgi:hypothetical protein